jgi:hypothetical protein
MLLNDMNPIIPEKLTKMKRQHSYSRERDQPWAKGCIYCNAPPPLTLEHIIPEGLGGALIIPNASCDACSKETHAFEGHAMNVMKAVRRQLGFPQKRRGAKDRLRRKEERFVLMLDKHKVKVPIEEFPALLMSLVFPFPGILLGQKTPEDKPLSGGVYSAELMEGFGEKLNRLRAKYRADSVSIVGIEPSGRGDDDDYGRMLAKIAHAYAAAELGCGNFHPLLLHTIGGLKPYCLSYFIGSGVGKIPPGDDLHEIAIDESVPGAEPYVVVKLRLFANRDTPTHYIVAGRRLEQPLTIQRA